MGALGVKPPTATDQDARLFADVLADLRRSNPDLCRQWFNELRPLGVASGQLRVRAESVVHRDYLQKHAQSAFNDSLVSVAGRLLTVRFLGPGEDAEPRDAAAPVFSGLAPPPASVTRATPDAARRRDALVLNPDNTFENFVTGSSNHLARAAALAVAEHPGKKYNPLFIHGGVGLGKTHLLQAICLRILARRSDTDLYYLSCESFTTQYAEAMRTVQLAEFRRKFREVDVLVVDDIHFLNRKDQSQEEFFHTFNTLTQSGRQVIVSSDAPPEDIPEIEDRLVSRFKQGMVALVEPPTYEMRINILKQKAELRGLTLPEDVLALVAARIDTNIRELEGAITQLQARSELEQRPPDLDMARQMLGEPEPAAAPEPTIQVVIKVVTDFYNVRLTDLQSKRRHRSVTLPRQVCMYLARKHTRHSLEEIGGHFGGRDHTTVMHAIHAVDVRRKENHDFDQQVAALDQRIIPSIRP